MKSYIDNQNGAVMSEYAIAVIFVIIVLLPVMAFLTFAASERANQSISTVNHISPCTDKLKALVDETLGSPDDACN